MSEVHETHTTQNILTELRNLHTQIQNHFNELDNLTMQNKTVQQEYFLTTFMHVMDRMSSDLIEAQEKYNNIDLQVKKDEMCISLATQVHFFKNQCFFLKDRLQEVEKLFNQERERSLLLQKQKKALNQLLIRKQKKIEKLRIRMQTTQKYIYDSPPALKIKPEQYKRPQSSAGLNEKIPYNQPISKRMTFLNFNKCQNPEQIKTIQLSPKNHNLSQRNKSGNSSQMRHNNINLRALSKQKKFTIKRNYLVNNSKNINSLISTSHGFDRLKGKDKI